MPPSRPRSWYGQFCSIYHLLSTDGGIPIARHIVWTISTGWSADWGVIIVWNTHKICRRVCAWHGYHPLIPSLTDRWDKQQSNYDRNSTCNQQHYLMRSGFISTLLGVVENMMIQHSWRSEVIDIMDGMQRCNNTSQQSTIYLDVMSDMYKEVKHDRR